VAGVKVEGRNVRYVIVIFILVLVIIR